MTITLNGSDLTVTQVVAAARTVRPDRAGAGAADISRRSYGYMPLTHGLGTQPQIRASHACAA